jgi:hypothetical protein
MLVFSAQLWGSVLSCVASKGVGPSTTLAWPGGSSLTLQWKWTRHDWKRAGSKNVVQTVYFSATLVLNSRVLLIYTGTVKEVPGYSVQNSPSGSFLYWGGSVGRGGIVYDIFEWDAQKKTMENVRTPVCFRILMSSLTSVSILCNGWEHYVPYRCL